MAKKETNYEAFVAKARAEKEQAEAALEKTKHEELQHEHCVQRALNFREYITGRRNKKRNKRLIDKGLTVESILKDTELMSSTEFYELFEEMAEDPDVLKNIEEITAGRREGYEEEQKILHELQMEAAAERRKKKE